jgi:hypothetical protein
LKSTIINMADRMKDAQDLKLESLFASDSIPDDGFSVRIEKRVRRQLWLRRLTLPIAVLIGGSIAIKPLAGLLAALVKLLSVLPANIRSNLEGVTIANVPQLSTIVFGGVLVIAAIMLTRLLED